MLTENSYTRTIDWWGLGVLIFEMLVGEVFYFFLKFDIFFTLVIITKLKIYPFNNMFSLLFRAKMKKKYLSQLCMMMFVIRDFSQSKVSQLCEGSYFHLYLNFLYFTFFNLCFNLYCIIICIIIYVINFYYIIFVIIFILFFIFLISQLLFEIIYLL